MSILLLITHFEETETNDPKTWLLITSEKNLYLITTGPD